MPSSGYKPHFLPLKAINYREKKYDGITPTREWKP